MQQGFGGVVLGSEAKAYACTRVHAELIDVDALCERVEGAVGNAQGNLHSGFGNQDRKLVTAQPGHGVRGPDYSS